MSLWGCSAKLDTDNHLLLLWGSFNAENQFHWAWLYVAQRILLLKHYLPLTVILILSDAHVWVIPYPLPNPSIRWITAATKLCTFFSNWNWIRCYYIMYELHGCIFKWIFDFFPHGKSSFFFSEIWLLCQNGGRQDVFVALIGGNTLTTNVTYAFGNQY